MPFTSSYENFALKCCLHKDVDDLKRGHSGIYCDYQRGEWHYDQLMTWIKRHVPAYALAPKELQNITAEDMTAKLERAFQMVYGPGADPEKRGEIGEIILHGLIRDIYNTSPLVSKIYYKSAQNDTVKGFDCVHVIVENGEIESLWLGEAKFHADPADAIYDAIKSIKKFLEEAKLRSEFLVVGNLLDKETEAGRLAAQLLNRGTSLDVIFPKVCIPVLITYESPTVNKHTAHSDDFLQQLQDEVESHVESFMKKAVGITEVDIHVFFLSLKQKQGLIEAFDSQLKGHQGYGS